MAKRVIPSVAQDFDAVLKFFMERGIIAEKAPGELVSSARRLHRATYSLILWRFRLRNVPEHGLVFLDEIASDALQILPQALMGYGKTTKLLIRGVIENTLRHIYFLDHPIEFARMNRESKWYLNMEELFAYPQIHPALLDTDKQFDATNKLKILYSELSASVHGRRVQDLEMRVALNRIVFDQRAFEDQVSVVERCSAASNFLLAHLHKEEVRRFQAEDHQIILRTMPARARQLWKGLAVHA